MMKKSTSLLLLTLALACSKTDTASEESEALAKQINGIQVGREGLNNDFNATASLKNNDGSIETLSFKANFDEDTKNYEIKEEENKPYVLHIKCDEADPLCNQSIVKVQGLDSSPLPGIATIEQFCIENPTLLPTILGDGNEGEYDEKIFATLVRDLAVEFGDDFRGADPVLSSRLILRRVQKTNKHFFNLSIYRTKEHSIDIYQMRGDEGENPLEFHSYSIANLEPLKRKFSKKIIIGSNTVLSRQNIEGNFNYSFTLKFRDMASGKIPAVLNIDLEGNTGGFESDDSEDNPNHSPFVFDWI